MKVVGVFSVDKGVLSGPAQYMKEQGREKLEKVLRGDDLVFNLSLTQSPDIETGILVAMQTDYAGYLGRKELISWIK